MTYKTVRPRTVILTIMLIMRMLALRLSIARTPAAVLAITAVFFLRCLMLRLRADRLIGAFGHFEEGSYPDLSGR